MDRDEDDDLIYIGKENNFKPKIKIRKDLIEKAVKHVNASNVHKEKVEQFEIKKHVPVSCEFDDTIDFKDDLLPRNSKLKLKKGCNAPAKNGSFPMDNIMSKDRELTSSGQNNSLHTEAQKCSQQSNQTCLNNNNGKSLPATDVKQCIICCAYIEISEYEIHCGNCLKSNFSLNSGAATCQICKKDISHMNVQRQTQHVNKCADKESDSYQELNKFANEAILHCPMCGQNFRTAARRQSHLKKCAATNKMSAEMVKHLVKQEEEEFRANLDAGILPEEYLPKSKKSDKRSVKKSKLSNDEDMHLAMALSVSLLEDNFQCDRNNLETFHFDNGKCKLAANQEPSKGKGHGKNKKRKQQGTSTLLMTLSKENAQATLLQSVDKYIFSKSSAYFITQTPPFKLKLDLRDNKFWSETAMEINEACGPGKFYVEKLIPPLTVSCIATGSKVKRMLPGRRNSIGGSQEGMRKLSQEDIISDSQTLEILTHLAMENEASNEVNEASNDEVNEENTCQLSERSSASFVNVPVEKSNSSLKECNKSGFYAESTKNKSEAMSLEESFLGLVNTNNFSDVTILTQDRKVFAHKVLLHARCPQLLNMMLCIDGHSIIDLSSYSEGSVLSILKYIYAGHISLPEIALPDIVKLSALLGLKQLGVASMSYCLTSQKDMTNEIIVDRDTEGEKEMDDNFDDNDWIDIYYSQRENLCSPNNAKNNVSTETVEGNVNGILKSESQTHEANLHSECNYSEEILRQMSVSDMEPNRELQVILHTATKSSNLTSTVGAIGKHTVTNTVTATSRPSVMNSVTTTSKPNVMDSVTATSRPSVMDSVTAASKPSEMDYVTVASRPSVMDSGTATSRPSVMDSVTATSRPSVMDSITATSRPSVMDSVTAASRPSVMDSITATSRPSVRDSVTAASRLSVIDSVTATSSPSVIDSVTDTSRPSVMDSVTATSRPSVMDSVTATSRPSAIDSVTAASRPSGMDSVTTTSRPSVMDSVTAASRPSVMDSVTAASRLSVMDSGTATSRPSVMDSITATSRPSVMDSVTVTSRPSVMDSVTATSRPSVMDYVTTTSRPSVMDSVTTTSRPSVMDSVTTTSRPSVMDSVTTTSRPSVMDSVTTTSRPSVMDSVTATSRPSVMDSVTTTSRPSVMDSVTTTSRPSVMDSVTATSRPSVTAISTPNITSTITDTNRPVIMNTVNVYNRTALVEDEQKSIEQSAVSDVHSPNVSLFNNDASETVDVDEKNFACELMNEDFETKTLELNIVENNPMEYVDKGYDSMCTTAHVTVTQLDTLSALKSNVEQGKDHLNSPTDTSKVSGLNKKIAQRKRKKKVTLKDFQKIVNKVVSELPTVSSSDGQQSLTDLLSNEDVENIAIKIENDFTNIYQCNDGNNSFFIPCILDPVEEDTDDITITFADIKEPFFKKRKPGRPKNMTRNSGIVRFTTVKTKSKEMTQLVSLSSTLPDDLVHCSGRDLNNDLSTCHSSSQQISSNNLSKPVQQVLNKSIRKTKKYIPVIGMNLTNISKEISKQLTDADLGKYLLKNQTSKGKSLQKHDISGDLKQSDVSSTLAPVVREEIQPLVKPAQGSVNQLASISNASVCISDDELFSDNELSSPAAPNIYKVNTSWKNTSDAVWSLSTMPMSSSPVSEFYTSGRETSKLPPSISFRKEMQYPINAMDTEKTVRRNEGFVKEKMFSIISDVVISNMIPQTVDTGVVISNMIPQTADTIKSNNMTKASADKITLTKSPIELIPNVQLKSPQPFNNRQHCTKVLTSSNTTSPNHKYITVSPQTLVRELKNKDLMGNVQKGGFDGTKNCDKNNTNMCREDAMSSKTCNNELSNTNMCREDAMSSKTCNNELSNRDPRETKAGTASGCPVKVARNVKEKKESNQVTADIKGKLSTHPDDTRKTRDKSVNKKTYLLSRSITSLAPSIYLANTDRQMESPGQNISKSKPVHSRQNVGSNTEANSKEKSGLYSSTPINTYNASSQNLDLPESPHLSYSQKSNAKTKRGLAKRSSPFILSRKFQSQSWTTSPVFNVSSNSQSSGRQKCLARTQEEHFNSNFESREPPEYSYSQPNCSVSKSISLESSPAKIILSPDLVQKMSESLAKITNQLNLSASSGLKENKKLVTNESSSKNTMKHIASSDNLCVIPSKNTMKHIASSDNLCVTPSKEKKIQKNNTHKTVQSVIDGSSPLPLCERLGLLNPFGYPKPAQDKGCMVGKHSKAQEESMHSVFSDSLNGSELEKLAGLSQDKLADSKSCSHTKHDNVKATIPVQHENVKATIPVQHDNVQAKTPVRQQISQLRKKKMWKEPSPFTPMPVYDEMTTPDLKKAASKIGVKPIGKKRLRELLKHVYHATHQYETDSDYDGTPLKQPRHEKMPMTLKANSQAGLKRNDSLSDNILFAPEPKDVLKPRRSKTVGLAKSGNKVQECEYVSHETETMSDVLTASQDFSHSDGPDLPEESILQGWPEDDLPIDLLNQANIKNPEQQLLQFITENEDIYHSVLLCEPLELDVFKKRLTDNGIKIGMDKVMNFLDEKCITFTMKNIHKVHYRNQRKIQVKKSKKTQK